MTKTSISENKFMTTTITLQYFDDIESAKILVNDKVVFSGNYWDFHQGCIGPIVAGYNLTNTWNDEGSEPENLLKALSNAFKKVNSVVTLVESFETDDCDAANDFYFGEITREEFLASPNAKVIQTTVV